MSRDGGSMEARPMVSERKFNYGPKALHLAIRIIGGTPLVALFGYALLNPIGSITVNGKPVGVWGHVLIGLFGAILLLGVVTSVSRIRRANQRRRDTLKMNQSGIVFYPNGDRDKMVVVPFRNTTETGVKTTGNDGIELVITHSAGKLRLEEGDFDDRNSFEACAALIATRSRTQLVRGWLTGRPPGA